MISFNCLHPEFSPLKSQSLELFEMFASLFTKKYSQIIHFSFLVLPLFHGIYANCNTAIV